MVSVATIVCIVISMLVSLALPVVLLAVFAVKCKKQGILPAWLLGAAGFFVTQILIRLPILTPPFRSRAVFSLQLPLQQLLR